MESNRSYYTSYIFIKIYTVNNKYSKQSYNPKGPFNDPLKYCKEHSDSHALYTRITDLCDCYV